MIRGTGSALSGWSVGQEVLSLYVQWDRKMCPSSLSGVELSC